MLDIKLLREDADFVKKNLKRRPGFDPKVIHEVLKQDAQWREHKGELDELKAQKNKESKKIAEVKKAGGDTKAQIAAVSKVVDQIKKKETELEQEEQKRNALLATLPNLLDKEVPDGNTDEENVEIKKIGKKPSFSFTVKNHQELCELNDWYDLESAAKHSGARFYYLKNELVELEQALFMYVLQKLIAKGYVSFTVPPMLRKESAERAIPLSDFEDTVYSLQDDEDHELFLIGTSEHALAVLHADSLLNHTQLPLRYCAYSQCFRREAGVTKDTKGIYRVHHFNKIEMFVYCKPEESDQFHEELMAIAEEIFTDLELHYRVIDICAGDLGMFAARKFDVEAWIPSQERYGEVVSGSNYRDYGARKLGVRFQNAQNEIEFVHTLNCTAATNTRPIIAMLEQHQTQEGDVKIPKVLQSFLGRKMLKR